jgi:hypothetical protein
LQAIAVHEPKALSSPASVRQLSASREQMNTLAPALTNASVMALPIPLLPPVIRTVLSFTPNSSLITSIGLSIYVKSLYLHYA